MFARNLAVTFAVAMAVVVACGDDESVSPTASPAPCPESPAPSALPRATPSCTSSPEPTPAPTPVPTATPPRTSTPATAPPTTPPPTGVAQVIRRGNTSDLLATLTFDAGSDGGYTNQILDTLAANGIRGAFGITGRWGERNPGLLQRITRDGHELIIHSYDHASFTGLSTGLPPLTQAQRWQQLDTTENIVRVATGATTVPYFRPPYGDYDNSVNVDVGARGYLYNIMWTVDSGGWKGIPASQITQICLDGAQPGVIYVFHVGSGSQDGPALQSIIDGLRARGYSMIPLSQKLGR